MSSDGDIFDKVSFDITYKDKNLLGDLDIEYGLQISLFKKKNYSPDILPALSTSFKSSRPLLILPKTV